MAKQSFVTGQVLTAAQMLSLQQTALLGGEASAKIASYVLVAADAGTAISMSNASATTITANTGLFAAGDIVTIINLGAGVCTITAGTATVATSGSLALAQNQGGVLRFTSASAAIFFQFATPASGDIEGVSPGVGISGGGSSGTVTITNSMATAIDAKGDLVPGTGADAFARLAVGTNDHRLVAASGEATGLKYVADTQNTVADAKGDLLVGTGADTIARLAVGANDTILVAASGEATGLKWAAPASGSLTLLSTTTLTSTSNAITIAPTGYVNLLVLFREVHAASNNGTFFGRFNADTGSNHTYGQWRKYQGGAGDFQVPQNQSSFEITNQLGTSSAYQSALSGSMDVFRVTDTSKIAFECRVLNFNDSSQAGWYHTFGNYNASAAITNLTLIGSQNLSGTVYIYGVK